MFHRLRTESLYWVSTWWTTELVRTYGRHAWSITHSSDWSSPLLWRETSSCSTSPSDPSFATGENARDLVDIWAGCCILNLLLNLHLMILCQKDKKNTLFSFHLVLWLSNMGTCRSTHLIWMNSMSWFKTLVQQFIISHYVTNHKCYNFGHFKNKSMLRVVCFVNLVHTYTHIDVDVILVCFFPEMLVNVITLD